jgi:O-antigen/teichoic acid export membrane protein
MMSAAAEAAPIGKGLKSALTWIYASTYIGKAAVFLSTLVLARILVPDDFALVAFGLAVIAFCDVADLGVGAALIYLDADDARKSASAVFTLHMIGVTILAGAVNAIAPWLASLVGDDRAQLVVHLMSIHLVLRAIGQTHDNILRRELDFRRRFIPDVSSGLVKAVVSIVLAVMGAGVWSLVAGQLLGSALRTVILWRIVPFRPHFDLGRGGRARRLVHYGIHISAIGILSQIALNVDYLIVGSVLGLTALGFYVIAFRIPELIIYGLMATAHEVFFPYYARARETGRDVGDRYIATLRGASLVAAPIVAALTALATPLILVLFGDTWERSADVMPGITLGAALMVLSGLPGDVYKAVGKPWILTVIAATFVAVWIPALLVVTPYGIVAVAWLYAAIALVESLVRWIVAGRVLSVRAADHLLALLPATIAGGAAAAVGVVISRSLEPIIALLAGLPAVMGVYAVVIWMLAPDVRRLMPMIRDRFTDFRSRTPAGDVGA